MGDVGSERWNLGWNSFLVFLGDVSRGYLIVVRDHTGHYLIHHMYVPTSYVHMLYQACPTLAARPIRFPDA